MKICENNVNNMRNICIEQAKRPGVKHVNMNNLLTNIGKMGTIIPYDPSKFERMCIVVKTTVKEMDYRKVMELPRPEHMMPRKPNIFWRTLVKVLSWATMIGTPCTYDASELDKIGKDEPCLILMNHTCFTDMQIAYNMLYPRTINIVCSNDGFIGYWGIMGWLMRRIGCFSTQKFVTDLRLVQDMLYCFKTLKSSILMYPEAGYSFDGTATTLPRKFGVLLKKFDVPVVMIETFGLYGRNPLYNELQIRKDQKITARARVLFTQEEVREKSVKELSDGVDAAFGFDHFKWQKENGIEINQDFRADGLDRILYKCAHCGSETGMKGKGTELVCSTCGKRYELTSLVPLGAGTGPSGDPEQHLQAGYRCEDRHAGGLQGYLYGR